MPKENHEGSGFLARASAVVAGVMGFADRAEKAAQAATRIAGEESLTALVADSSFWYGKILEREQYATMIATPDGKYFVIDPLFNQDERVIAVEEDRVIKPGRHYKNKVTTLLKNGGAEIKIYETNSLLTASKYMDNNPDLVFLGGQLFPNQPNDPIQWQLQQSLYRCMINQTKVEELEAFLNGITNASEQMAMYFTRARAASKQILEKAVSRQIPTAFMRLGDEQDEFVREYLERTNLHILPKTEPRLWGKTIMQYILPQYRQHKTT